MPCLCRTNRIPSHVHTAQHRYCGISRCIKYISHLLKSIPPHDRSASPQLCTASNLNCISPYCIRPLQTLQANIPSHFCPPVCSTLSKQKLSHFDGNVNIFFVTCNTHRYTSLHNKKLFRDGWLFSRVSKQLPVIISIKFSPHWSI